MTSRRTWPPPEASSRTPGKASKRGGADYKPFTSGDIWSPNLDMGPDVGRAEMTYEVVKGVGALDDGKDLAAEKQQDEQDQK